MRCYLAHPVTDYGGTARQRRAIELIELCGMEVVSPDAPHHGVQYLMRGMGYFVELVRECDALAFMRFPDGSVGAGVAREIRTALAEGMPVYDTDHGMSRVSQMPGSVLSVDETRALIKRLSSSPRDRATTE